MILVVGSVNMDLSVTVDRLPIPGETLLGRPLHTGLGGKGANQAVAAARLGAAVTLLGSVGNDAFGHTVQQLLNQEPLTSQLTLSDQPTGTAFIAVASSGDNTIIVSPGANTDPPEQLTPPPDVTLLVTQFEIARTAWTAALRAGRQRGLRTVVNASPLHDVTLEDLMDADVLIVNEIEAAQLLGTTLGSPAEALEQAVHLAQVLPAAVITLGAQGAVWAEGTASGRVAAHPVVAQDTTGAGDAFCGALCAALHEGHSLADAVTWGNAAGALTATKAGTTAALPTRAELRALLISVGAD